MTHGYIYDFIEKEIKKYADATLAKKVASGEYKQDYCKIVDTTIRFDNDVELKASLIAKGKQRLDFFVHWVSKEDRQDLERLKVYFMVVFHDTVSRVDLVTGNVDIVYKKAHYEQPKIQLSKEQIDKMYEAERQWKEERDHGNDSFWD